jgi:hypothetical protein
MTIRTTLMTTKEMSNLTAGSAALSVRRFGVVALALACVLAAVAGPAAAASGVQESRDDGSSTVVALQSDGDAEVTLAVTFDLTTDAEREAFESLRANETKQADLREQYGDRMGSVAAAASNETDREMTVGDPSIAFETADGSDRGLVRLSVTWSNLAAVEGDRMTVSEPFASGFAPEGEFSVVAPEGYDIESTTPAPDESTVRRATWTAGSDLDGFEAVVESDDGPETGDRLPGFGVQAALAALLAGIAGIGYRRRAD